MADKVYVENGPYKGYLVISSDGVVIKHIPFHRKDDLINFCGYLEVPENGWVLEYKYSHVLFEFVYRIIRGGIMPPEIQKKLKLSYVI